MKTTSQKLHVDRSLDLRGITRQVAYRRALAQLKELTDQKILELYLDEGEALRSIPFGLRAEGHEIVVSEPANQGVRLLVRKRPPFE